MTNAIGEQPPLERRLLGLRRVCAGAILRRLGREKLRITHTNIDRGVLGFKDAYGTEYIITVGVREK